MIDLSTAFVYLLYPAITGAVVVGVGLIILVAVIVFVESLLGG